MAVPVTWFKLKNRGEFINYNDTGDHIFVHHTAITKNHPQKIKWSVAEREAVEVSMMEGEEGQTFNVIGPGGIAVQGSSYAADRRPFRSHWFPGRGQP